MMIPEPHPQIEADFGERTINELVLMYRNGQINLEPGFQRKSVWGLSDRRRLIQSIVLHYPLPSIFLYKRNSRGKLVYDVIDGKQRLETILMFLRVGGFRRGSFDVRLDLDDEPGLEWYEWPEIKKRYPHVRHALESYKIQTVEVTGELAEIIDLFVRINSTGKPLTSGEKRHARFYDSRFLKEAESLVHRFRNYLLAEGITSQTQLARMKGTELFAELLMSIQQGGIINKKTALDRAIGNDRVDLRTLGRISREFVATLNTVRKMFPDLKETRFHNTADYYSLFMLVWEMRGHGFVLTDQRRNKVAQRLLRKLSVGVDQLRDQLKRVKPPKRTPPIYSEYLLTVQGDTDSAATRERRREILRSLLFSLFDYRDAKRMFSPEQRRIIWGTEERRTCAACGHQLSWDDFTVDHITAWIKGGKTTLKNAQLLCRACNSRKGAR